MVRICLSLLLIFSLLACTQKSGEKELIVGTDAAYAPFEIQKADKSVEGFDIEVISAVAHHAGFKIKVINTPWEGLFTQLDSGDRDILISAITINDERKKVMDFSTPYFEAVQLIAVPKNSKATQFQDLKKLKIGVQTGTTGDEIASKLLGKTSDQIKRFEGTPLALQELGNGGVDAVIADNGVINNFLKNNPGNFKTIADPNFTKEFYGIAVRKGRTDLLTKINSSLAALKQDGTLDQIYNKYFSEK